MTHEVREAVEEIRRAFPQNPIQVEEEPQGGAYVTVHNLEIGPRYSPPQTWIGFLITFQYPFSDVYPHFMDVGVARTDGAPHSVGLAQSIWQGRPVWQISRRSNRLDPNVDTAASKLAKVIEWLKSQ